VIGGQRALSVLLVTDHRPLITAHCLLILALFRQKLAESALAVAKM